jgi:hypothetical protein
MGDLYPKEGKLHGSAISYHNYSQQKTSSKHQHD